MKLFYTRNVPVSKYQTRRIQGNISRKNIKKELSNYRLFLSAMTGSTRHQPKKIKVTDKELSVKINSINLNLNDIKKSQKN